MELYLDDRRTEAGADQDATLGELINDVKARLADAGRILVGIECDGIDVTGSDYDEALTGTVGAYRRIDMQSADPAALVADALHTAEEVLDASQQTSAETVDLLSQGDIQGAMPKLGECCQAWSQVHVGICNSIAMLGAAADSLQIEDRTLPELLAVPTEHLRQIKEAVEVKDFVLLSDILSYEFPEALSAWRKIIDALIPAATSTQP